MAAGEIVHLTDRALVSVSGKEARSFLQGLVTVNMEAVSAERAAYAALLTPQGKILFDFFIAGNGDGFLFDCAADQASDLIKRLTFYKLRAEVEVAEGGIALNVFAITDADGAFAELAEPGAAMERDGALVYRDPRLAEAGVRVIATQTQAAALAAACGLQHAPLAAYHTRRIALGLGDSAGDIGSGVLFPHEANLDQLHGVDFSKGCYVGQEVVSRMQHRGTARSRLVPVELAAKTGSNDSEVTAGDKAVGRLRSRQGTSGLALLRLDRAGAALAAGEALHVGKTTLRIAKPDWADFELTAGEAAE